MKYCLILTILLAGIYQANADIIVLHTDEEKASIGDKVYILEDSENAYTIEDVLTSEEFKPSGMEVPNLNITHSTFWVRFTIENRSASEKLLLNLSYPIIDEAVLFERWEEGIRTQTIGEKTPFSKRNYNHQDLIFDLNIQPGSSKTYFLKVKSGEQVMLPISIGGIKPVFAGLMLEDWFFGIYFGIMGVMFLYNLFVYFSTRDKSYLLYVIYIACVCLTMASGEGFTYKYLWPEVPYLANLSVTWFPSFVGIAAMMFMREFLKTRENTPRLDKVFIWLTGSYALCMALFITGFPQISYQLTQSTALIVSLFMFFVAYRIHRMGYRPAKFFLVAWSIFLAGVVVFVLKDFGVLAYNALTSNILQIGSGAEAIMLSMALADRINILKKEKAESQEKVMEALRENERITREQNIILEAKVKERTHALELSNKDLNKVLRDLKSTQSQLVDAEKMASLGQLTAGIAHEINNPINFVVSNIKPLRRDVQDILELLEKYKEIEGDEELKRKLKDIEEFKEEIELDIVIDEIESLLTGIEDGANRTSEIVKSLRNFSRLDESDLKKANINEGLESTLTLLNSSINGKIRVIRKFADLELVECYAGKLNQLFMNVLNNAVHAIQSKYQNGEGILTLTTLDAGENIIIGIQDNGIGMTEEVKGKIFDPFFTTKDVGEGTGLGLSIAYSIMEKHNGAIHVESEPGVGTEFIITIPKSQNIETAKAA